MMRNYNTVAIIVVFFKIQRLNKVAIVCVIHCHKGVILFANMENKARHKCSANKLTTPLTLHQVITFYSYYNYENN